MGRPHTLDACQVSLDNRSGGGGEREWACPIYSTSCPMPRLANGSATYIHMYSNSSSSSSSSGSCSSIHNIEKKSRGTKSSLRL